MGPRIHPAPVGAALCLLACAAPPEGSPPHPAAIAAVEFLPEIHADGARQARVLYQDGAVPVVVPGGTLWTFGDTFLGTRRADGSPDYSGSLSNTMALLPELPEGAGEHPPRLRYLTDDRGVARAPLLLAPDEDPKTRRLWPLAGVWLGARGYLFFGLIDVTGPGPWGFKAVGTGLARAEQPFGPYQRLAHPGGQGWPMDPSAIVRADGMLYLYAPRRFGGAQALESGLLVGRVPEADLEDPARYEFCAGRDPRGGARWVARIEDARPACADVWGQASVAWNPHLCGYLLATSSSFFHHDQIQLRCAPTPWGPWRPLVPDDGLVRVPERQGETTQLIYCTMLHPELDQDGGAVLTLTFCRMLTRAWAFTNPEAVRLTLGPAARRP